jgi:uncharacterized protein HemX
MNRNNTLIRNNNGSTLVIVLLGIAVVAILGIGFWRIHNTNKAKNVSHIDAIPPKSASSQSTSTQGSATNNAAGTQDLQNTLNSVNSSISQNNQNLNSANSSLNDQNNQINVPTQ